jgi:DNA polymerase-1
VAKKKMFLVDGSNHAFRVQFALPPQHASDGFPTRVLYGFTLLFQRMMRTYRPDYCVVSFDSGKTFRHETYPDYKGHRPEMPEDLRRQWGLLPDLVESFGYRCIASPGYEADDVLGTLARQFASDELDVYIVSSDKDFCQLLDDNTMLLDDTKGKVTKASDVPEKLGCSAEQVIDLLGLAGDSSDNIPGVPGVGVKTAAKLLAEYQNLEAILDAAAAGRIKGKRGQNLVEHADNARLSAVLATIETAVPISPSLEELAPRGVQEVPLREMFDRWEFGMVARKLLPAVQVVDRSGYRAALTDAALHKALSDIRAEGGCGIAIREAGADWVGASLAWSGGVVYVPLTERPGVELDIEAARQELLALFADPSVAKIGHDLKPVFKRCRAAGLTLAGDLGDTRLLDYVLVAHRRSHGLADIAQRQLGHTLAYMPAEEPLMIQDVVEFAGEPADVSRQLHGRLQSRLDAGTRHVYEQIELPLTPILCEMEEVGIRLDCEVLAEIERDIAGRVGEVETKCHEAAGRPFNVGSTKEVGLLLFEELGLPPSKRTKTGYSTDSSVLEKLEDKHPLPAVILEWRQLSKLLNTYLKKLPQYVGKDGRVHTTFNQAVAATGRLSSNDPNLQNIPIRTFEGRRIRDAFVPAEGCVFLSCDYSQVELRVLAHFCGEGALVESFMAGEDIHRRTASEVWGVPIGEVTAQQRSAAKAINFGLLYGMSAFRLGRDLSISREQAQTYMDDYFGRIPSVQRWIEETKASCKARGYVDTLYGRRRLIPEIYAKNFNDRSAGEREAVNTRVQGTAADLIKMAMIRVDGALKEGGFRSRMLLQVHDELLLEVPQAELLAVQSLVVGEMRAAGERLIVPLDVTAAAGLNWNQAHG